jgi:hypothetical protein
VLVDMVEVCAKEKEGGKQRASMDSDSKLRNFDFMRKHQTIYSTERWRFWRYSEAKHDGV